MSINTNEYNQKAWDHEAKKQVEWSQPVTQEIINEAKKGKWSVPLMPNPLPSGWLPDTVTGLKILCLASGGGQQAPIFAAAGAEVAVLDNSKEQLALDEMVAKRDNLVLTTKLGSMTDLSDFENDYFDIIFHPISNLYVEDINPVWQESYRVLKQNGILLSSFYNPVVFIFDKDTAYRKEGFLKPKYSLPYSDLKNLTENELMSKLKNNEPLIFGHSLTEQIGGQIKAGFVIADFLENYHPSKRFLIDEFMPTFIATKAIKLIS
jgi:SAM-dependent methyltransferase